MTAGNSGNVFDIELQAIHSGYDRKTCWVHARPGAIPGNPASVVVTMHKLRLTGSDVFYPINDMRSDDLGKTWTDPDPHEEAFSRRPVNEYGFQEGVCDFTPAWHEKTGVLLGTGHTVRRWAHFLTLRNNESGYVAAGVDGLHFDRPRRWNFDNGVDLGNYNTQQHWLTHGDDLYLIYTRWGANNDHVFRHRAPLFIAQVDKDCLCVQRETEQVLVPERGARLGNFGVTKIDEREYWVAVSEWMQTNPPDHFDSTVCEKYGSDNSVFVAKVRFK